MFGIIFGPLAPLVTKQGFWFHQSQNGAMLGVAGSQIEKTETAAPLGVGGYCFVARITNRQPIKRPHPWDDSFFLVACLTNRRPIIWRRQIEKTLLVTPLGILLLPSGYAMIGAQRCFFTRGVPLNRGSRTSSWYLLNRDRPTS